MVVYADITRDSRVQREASALAAAGHLVTLFCLAGAYQPPVGLRGRVDIVIRTPAAGSVIPGSPSPFRQQRPSGNAIRRAIDRVRWLVGYVRNLRAWGRAITSTAGAFDVWHAHDFAGLVAVGTTIRRGAALVYDVHDLFVETGTASHLPGPMRWAIRRYERRLVRRVDLVVAVNRPLAAIVRERYRPRSIIVVHNCVPRWTAGEPRPNLLRHAAGIPATAPIVLYHGLLGSSRGLEALAEAILRPGLERAHLVLMGYGELQARLTAMAAEPRFRGRLHVLEAVPPADLLPWVASADVGAMAMPHATLNLFISTPNKLFECLAAGTPVVVSDFPAVSEIAMDDPGGPLGATCDPSNVGDIARAIEGILALDAPAAAELRRRCAAAARDRWNWESEVLALTSAYEAFAADPARMREPA